MNENDDFQGPGSRAALELLDFPVLLLLFFSSFFFFSGNLPLWQTLHTGAAKCSRLALCANSHNGGTTAIV